MSLSCTVSEIQRDNGRKSPFEPTPSLFGAPVGILRKCLALQNVHGVACVILHLAVLMQYWRVTDRHTTTAHTALALHRAVKTITSLSS